MSSESAPVGTSAAPGPGAAWLSAAQAALAEHCCPLWAAWQHCWRADPEAPALITAERVWTRAQLARWAQAVAAALRSQGVAAGAIIAIHGQRGAAVVAAQLAVLECGACYVALEPDLPSARRELICRETALAAWLECEPASTPAASALPQLPLIRLADLLPPAECEGRADWSPDKPSARLEQLHNPAAALQPLYLLYTSGSSGRPKGVLGTRLGLWQRLAWQWQHYPFQAQERVAWRTPLGFVDAVAESWGALLGGVPLVLISNAQVRDLDQFIAVIETQRITRLLLVPSLLDAILRAAPDLQRRWATLRLAVCSGERWDAGLAQRALHALPQCCWLNLYGMTEAAADATVYALRAPLPGAALPIGQPLAGLRVQLLAADAQIPPQATQGVHEIALGGTALALGYYRQPALTAAAFIPDPDPAYPGARLYCSGDLGRWDEAGELHYHGRRDQQVQLRGQRVELGEIEQAALQHPAVALCAALVPEQGVGAGVLILSLALAPGAQLTAQALREFLQPRLPAYMMPALIEIRPQLPLLSNGKIDRQALAASRLHCADGGAPPSGASEQALALIWQEVLRCAPPGRHSQFLQLGGNSLHAALVVSRVRAHWGVALSMVDFFAHADLAAQAAWLEQQQTNAAVEVVEF